MYHYVYISYENDGRNYIGVHSSNSLHNDYLGSFSDVGFNPTEKIILQVFKTREAAVQFEIMMHRVFNVKHDPEFANRAHQTSTKFDTSGTKAWHNEEGKMIYSVNVPSGNWKPGATENLKKLRSQLAKVGIIGMKNKKHKPETIKKFRETRAGSQNAMYGKNHSFESKLKMSIAKRGKKMELTWWNDGTKEMLSHEQPDFEWMPGRIKRSWWHTENGESKMNVGSPGPEWKPGRGKIGKRTGSKKEKKRKQFGY